MNKLRYIFFSIFLLTLVIAFTGAEDSEVLAVNSSDWSAGHIIDDGVFTDSKDMSVSQIQKFLDAKVGTNGYDSVPGECDNHGERNASPYDSNITRKKYAENIGYKDYTFTCLNRYYEVPKTEPGPGMPYNNFGNQPGDPNPEGSVSAARIIYNAAQESNISPRVLLVMLQKESAGPLVTDDWPFEKQYRYAMGAHCPDGENGAECDEDYAGFSLQMYEAARLFRWYIDSMDKDWWQYRVPHQTNYILWQTVYDGSGNLTNCGGSDVHINTYATAALYTYTPYQPNKASLQNYPGRGDRCSSYGNRNFWFMFNNWFGSPTPSRDITVITSAETSKLYLLSGSKKIHIANPTVYKAWGLDKVSTTRVEHAVLSSYEEASYPLRRFALSRSNGVRYFVDDEVGYGIPSQNMADAWDFPTSGMPVVDGVVIKNLKSRDVLTPIVDSPVGHEKYMMDGGTLRHYPTTKSLDAWEKNKKSMKLSEGYFCKSGSGDSCEPRWPEGSKLWHTKTMNPDGETFVIDQNKKYSLPTNRADAVLGSMIEVSNATLNRKKNSDTFQRLIKVTDEPHIYLTNGNKLHRIASPQHLQHWKPDGNGKTTTITDKLSRLFTIDSTLSGFTATDGEKSYYINQGKHLLNDASMAPYSSHHSPVKLKKSVLQSFTTKRQASPIVTSTQTGKIFLLNSTGTKHHIASPAHLSLIRGSNNVLKTMAIPHTMIRAMNSGATAKNTFTNNASTFLFDRSAYRQVLSEEWSINTNLELGDASLSWFEAKADLHDKVSFGDESALVRNGVLYSTKNARLSSLWSLDNVPNVSKQLANQFNKKTLSPFVDSSNPDNPRIYIFDSDNLYHIPNMASWRNLGLKQFSGRVTLADSEITTLTNGRATYILDNSAGVMDNGARRKFSTEKAGTSWAPEGSAKYSQKLIDLLTQKTLDDTTGRLITSSKTSKWFCVEDGQKRWVTSFTALQNSGCGDESLVTVSHNLLSQIPTGDNIR